MSLSLIISLGCLMLCAIFFLYFRSYINKKTSDGELKEVRDEVNRIIARIDEITEKDISLIEDKESQLKTLLDDCDKRLSVLNRELDRREIAEKTYRDMGKNPIPIELKFKPPVEAKPEPKEDAQSLEDKISGLVRSGFSPSVIASRLGISITEAELRIDLLERRNS